MKKIFILLFIVCLLISCCACENNTNEPMMDNSSYESYVNNESSNEYDESTNNSYSEPSGNSSTNNNSTGTSNKPATNNNSTGSSDKPSTNNNSTGSSNKPATNNNSTGSSDKPSTNNNSTSSSNKPQHTHSYSTANCTQAATCSCGKTQGSALGHNYSDGVCKRCGSNDPNYIRTYSAGEYWVVDGQWKFTINKVTVHTKCNSYSDATGEQVVFIDYSYEHLGYNGSNVYGLIFQPSTIKPYDQEGYLGSQYPCTHDDQAGYCASKGTKAKGTLAYILENTSSKITIHVQQLTGDIKMKQASFEIAIS